MKKKRAEYQDELVVPGTGTRIPVPEGATDDDIDELVITHPALVARAARDRGERTSADTIDGPAANGQVPKERTRRKAARR